LEGDEENRKIRKGKDLMGSKQNRMGKGKDFPTDIGLERITLEKEGTGSNQDTGEKVRMNRMGKVRIGKASERINWKRIEKDQLEKDREKIYLEKDCKGKGSNWKRRGKDQLKKG
jgi:hypothetical protein